MKNKSMISESMNFRQILSLIHPDRYHGDQAKADVATILTRQAIELKGNPDKFFDKYYLGIEKLVGVQRFAEEQIKYAENLSEIEKAVLQSITGKRAKDGDTFEDEEKGAFGWDDIFRKKQKPEKSSKYDDKGFNSSNNYGFEDVGDGTIIDNLKKLMWQQDGSKYMVSLQGIKEYINKLNTGNLAAGRRAYGGYSDWRLPNPYEMGSLMMGTRTNGLFVHPMFSNVQSICWTSKKHKKLNRTTYTICANFIDGDFQAVDPKGMKFFVRAVRPAR